MVEPRRTRRGGKMSVMRACVMIWMLSMVTAEASAQTVRADPGIIYKKKTIFSFEDDTIDGDLTKPDGAFVESRKRVRHSNLIKIRDNFRDKILNSVSKI